jgi:hypothetical protein
VLRTVRPNDSIHPVTGMHCGATAGGPLAEVVVRGGIGI